MLPAADKFCASVNVFLVCYCGRANVTISQVHDLLNDETKRLAIIFSGEFLITWCSFTCSAFSVTLQLLIVDLLLPQNSYNVLLFIASVE